MSTGLAEALQAGVVALSILAKLERTDGVAMGFTSADTAIVYGGLTYEPSESVGSSAISSSVGTGVDNMDIAGILSGDRITEDDLAKGLYDGARITVMMIDRANVSNGVVTLMTGYLGDIEMTDGQQFKTDARSLASRLKQTIGDTTSKVCRCKRVGDAQCRLNMAGTSNSGNVNRTNRIVASASADGTTITLASDPAPSGHYSWGVVKFVTGLNAGVSRDTKVHDKIYGEARVSLRGTFPHPISAGDQVQIDVGCDRLFTTCQSKFGNANNYHGEWQLPGNDTIIKVGRQ
jgi:uncharacterized phage protein (TIGR02218 family)